MMSILGKDSNRLMTIGIALAVVSAAAVTCYSYCKAHKSKTVTKLPDCPEGVLPQVWKAFEQAVRRIQTKKSLRTGDKLMLYAVYKQATVGDAPEHFEGTESWNVIVQKAKHDAWSRMRGMSPEEAAVHYVTAVAALEAEDPTEVDDDDEDMLGFGSPAVSRPIVENGDYTAGEENHSEEAKLLAAAGENNVGVVQKLLQAGVSVHHADAQGQTALHMAADRGSIACLKILLEHGANPKASDKDGISVLQAAVISGHVETCRILLEHGADPDQEDLDGDTPRSCAEDDGSPAILGLLDKSEQGQ